jgi:hypothetical protein
MSPKADLYLVERTADHGGVSMNRVWSQDDNALFGGRSDHLLSVSTGDGAYVFAVDRQTGATEALRLDATNPSFAPVRSTIDLNGAWDIVESFEVGGVTHLLTYASDSGQFGYFPITSDLRAGRPYLFARARGEDKTPGFTTVAPVVIGGFVYQLCYDFDSGRVVIYALRVTARSEAGSPPLLANSVWVHQWARKWTNFAFFELGGESFFLKTNVGRLNVNIDHILDDPSGGTIEVRSHLDLDDALDIDLVRSFTLGRGDPYFLSHLKNGETRINRIGGDCGGWDTEAALSALADAQVVAIQAGGRCFILFVG